MSEAPRSAGEASGASGSLCGAFNETSFGMGVRLRCCLAPRSPRLKAVCRQLAVVWSSSFFENLKH